MIKKDNPSIIFITETWSNEADPCFSDLELVKFNRHICKREKRGGGLAILLEPNIPSTHVESIYNDHFELLCIDIRFSRLLTIRTILVYRTPSCSADFNEELIEALQRLSDRNTIITGDFNLPEIDWANGKSNTSRGSEFLYFLQNFNYKQFVKEPTRFTKILDLVLSNTDIIENVTCSPGISDHELVTFHINVPMKKHFPIIPKYNTDKIALNRLDGQLFSHLNDLRIHSFSIEDKYNRMQGQY